jgi:tetratricopeptide (TPR) repeat protein
MKGSDKDEAINDLCVSLLRERPLKLSSIEQIESALTPDELTRSFDTIAQLKVKSLLADGQFYQAYQELRYALEQDPLNVYLQLVHGTCIYQCSQNLLNLLHDSPTDSGIEPMYNIVKNESAINAETSALYAKHLVSSRRYREAMELVAPLIAIFPAQRGLRGTVEILAQHIPHPILINFLQTAPPKLAIEIVAKNRTASETLKLTRSYHKIQNHLETEGQLGLAEKALTEILGDWPNKIEMDPALKDFYFLKSVLNLKKQRPLDAVHCLQLLLEMDPANIYVRNYRSTCVSEAFQMTEALVKKGEFLESICDFYACFSQYGVPSYTFIAEVAKEHIRKGRMQIGKELVQHMIAINPIDCDYLIAALEVALETNQSDWAQEIFAKIALVHKARPWDLKLGALLEEQPTSSAKTVTELISKKAA